MLTIQSSQRLALSLSNPVANTRRINSKSLSHLSFDQIKDKIASTYAWVSFNAASTAAAAGASYHTGVAENICLFSHSHHPLVSVGAMLAITLPPVYTMTALDEKQHPTLKKIALITSNAALGAIVSPIGFLGPDVIIPAVGVTTTVSAALALVTRQAKDDFHLKYKSPLKIGLFSLVGISFCGLTFPGSLGSLSYAASLYGGLALFSGFLVADVQEAHKRAATPEYCPIDQSYLIFLDTLNLFTRITEIKANYQKQSNNLDVISKISVEDEIEKDRKNAVANIIAESEIIDTASDIGGAEEGGCGEDDIDWD